LLKNIEERLQKKGLYHENKKGRVGKDLMQDDFRRHEKNKFKCVSSIFSCTASYSIVTGIIMQLQSLIVRKQHLMCMTKLMPHNLKTQRCLWTLDIFLMIQPFHIHQSNLYFHAFLLRFVRELLPFLLTDSFIYLEIEQPLFLLPILPQYIGQR
jgi:hypothetical protein